MSSRGALQLAIAQVVSAGNCSGCGGCVHLSSAVSLEMDEKGWLAPRVDQLAVESADEAELADAFGRMCPGRVVVAPDSSDRWHPVFGSYREAWVGWAADPDIRHAGSSGGVLSALAAWLIRVGEVDRVVAATGDPARADQSRATLVTDRASILLSAGSRYAPVSTLASLPLDGATALIGRPCECSALRSLSAVRGQAEDAPPMLSFFCAGVPSQKATEELLTKLGARPDEVRSLRYRGDGWPGEFVVELSSGEKRRLSYAESWGAHLGRKLPWRCKLCPDGTGGDADIAVGDYWVADDAGYPTFADGQGRSVVIARTARGAEWVRRAEQDGVLVLEGASLDSAARMQPLQDARKRNLALRMAARVLVGRRVPRYRGFHLFRISTRSPVQAARVVLGTVVRSLAREGVR